MINGILGVRCPMFTQIYRLNIHPCSLIFAFSHVFFFTNRWLVVPSDFPSQTAKMLRFCCVSWDFLDMETTNYQPIVNWFGARWLEICLNWGHPIGWSYPRLWMIGFWCNKRFKAIFRGSETPFFFWKTEIKGGHSGPPSGPPSGPLATEEDFGFWHLTADLEFPGATWPGSLPSGCD